MIFETLSKEVIENIREKYPNLTKLKLNSHKIQKIENLDLLSSLSTLIIPDNKITSLIGLNGNPKLVELDISQNLVQKCEGISKLTSLEVLNLSQNQISDLSEIQKLKVNVSLRELDLTGNPICDIDEYRDQVLKTLPNLKMLDKIPVIQNEVENRERNKNRIQIESLVEKFLKSKVPPNLRLNSSEGRMTLDQNLGNGLKGGNPSQTNNIPLSKPILEESKELLPNLRNMRNAHSLSQSSISALRTPFVNLDPENKSPSGPHKDKPEKSGLFSFIKSQNLDPSHPPVKDSLKEIIEMQEDFIQKKNSNLIPELLQKWRNKVFELLFQAKRTDLQYSQKFRTLEKDKIE